MIRDQFKQSVAVKMLIAIAVIIILLFGGTLWYTSKRTNEMLLFVHAESSARFGEFTRRTLQLAMETNNRPHLQSMLSEGGQAPGVESLRVLDDKGKIAFSNNLAEIGSVLSNSRELEILDRASKSAEAVERHENGKEVSAIPLRSDSRCVHCHEPLGKYLGAILLTLDVSDMNMTLDSIRMQSVWYFLGALLFTVLIMHGLMRLMVLRPLFRIVDNAKHMAQGDLSHDVVIRSQDEVGQLAGSLHAMQDHLRNSLQVSKTVAQSINQAVTDLDSSSEDLVTVAMEQSSGAAEQAASVHEVTSTAQEIAATSSQISSNVESIRSVAEETYRACVRGRDEVRNAVNGMETVKDKVRSIADATVELGRKSQKIGNIVSIIDEISEQTHLLALNAAIEAAGAGEHGKRFSVVATEVRRLAERTVEATTEIKGLIEEIQDSTNETVMITERGAAIVLEGASKVDLIGESLEELLTLVMQTKDAAKEMAVATQQQALAGDQLVMTISDINGVAVQVSRAAEQVEKSVMRLKNIADTLKELSDRNREYEKFLI